MSTGVYVHLALTCPQGVHNMMYGGSVGHSSCGGFFLDDTIPTALHTSAWRRQSERFRQDGLSSDGKETSRAAYEGVGASWLNQLEVWKA